MFKNWTDKVISGFVLLSFAGGMAPTVAYAISHQDALYDSRAEVENIEANFEEAKGGYQQSKEELQVARADLKSMTRKNIENAARTKREILRLQNEQARNSKETGVLVSKVDVLKKEIRKNENEEAQVRGKAEAVAAQLRRTRESFENATQRRGHLQQDLKHVKSRLADVQSDLNGLQKKLKEAQAAEQASARSLKVAQASLAKFEVSTQKETQRLEEMTKAALAQADINERKADMLIEKKKQKEEALERKRERLSEAKEKQRKALARVGENSH